MGHILYEYVGHASHTQPYEHVVIDSHVHQTGTLVMPHVSDLIGGGRGVGSYPGWFTSRIRFFIKVLLKIARLSQVFIFCSSPFQHTGPLYLKAFRP